MIAAVFSMQGIGQLMAAVVSLITAVGFRSSFGNVTDVGLCDAACRVAADRSWRIVVGVGAIPACLALYYRVTIPETPRYTFDVEHDIEKAGADIKAYVSSKSKGDFDVEQQARLKKIAGPSLEVPRASWMDLFHFFRTWKNLKMLIGTTLSWFCLVRWWLNFCVRARFADISEGFCILRSRIEPGRRPGSHRLR